MPSTGRILYLHGDGMYPMKHLGTSLLAIFLGLSACMEGARAQNLVPNPGFEEFRQCPRHLGNASDDLSAWDTPTLGSTDFFHACSQTMGAPENFNGRQGALEGEGYAGFYAYAPEDYREYLQVALLRPLEEDRPYQVSFWVSLSERSDFAVEDLGVLFASKPLRVRTKKNLSKKRWYAQPGNQYHYLESQGPGFLSDTEDWQEVRLEFTARGTERYLLLGNFLPNSQTRKRETGRSSNKGAYYYLDQVSVRPVGPPVASKTYPLDSLLVLPALLFEFDTARLTPAGESELSRLQAFVRTDSTYTLELRGHTDALGTDAYNRALSERRCRAVAGYLGSQGLEPDRIRWQAYGATRPVGDNATPEGRRQNRRVEFRIVSLKGQ